MKKTLLSLALFAAVTSSAFAADTYVIDQHHTHPTFEVSHLGFSLQHGRFDKATGQVVLDTAARSGSIKLSIDVDSLNMGMPAWNKHLLSEDFFNAAQYPTITFSSDKLVFEGNKVVAAEGTLTLLGVSKPVRLAVSNFTLGAHPMNKKAMGGANISVTIKRSDFGMNKYLPAVGDEVRISAPVEAYKE